MRAHHRMYMQYASVPIQKTNGFEINKEIQPLLVWAYLH